MHTDVLPSESMEKGEDCIYSLLALSYTHIHESAPKIKQFKEYRTKKRKLAAAQKITNAIVKKLYGNLRVVGSVAKGTDVLSNGQNLLDTLPNNLLTLTSTHCEIPEGKIPIKQAKFIAWYTLCLSILSIHLAGWAGQAGAEHAEFLIDPLPGDTPGQSTVKMRLMEILSEHTEVKQYWRQSRVENNLNGVGFSYALLPLDGSPSHKPVKSLNLSALVDWFVQGSFAASNSAMYNDNCWTEKERKQIVAPFFELHSKGHLKLSNMGVKINFG